MISPVRFSDLAAPILPVVKNDGTICICGDYKVTANLVAKQDSYPLPHVEELFAKVSGVTETRVSWSDTQEVKVCIWT